MISGVGMISAFKHDFSNDTITLPRKVSEDKFLSKFIVIDVYCMCLVTNMNVICMECPWMSKEGTDPLELEIQVIVSHLL